jgi:spermidine synthase
VASVGSGYTSGWESDGIVEPVELGTAELVPDPRRPAAWTLLVDGVAQSYVDLGDPLHLEFEYVRRVAAVLDAAAPRGAALRALHLGAGGLTIPRYLAATRPGSRQRVVERDARLAKLVQQVLPVPPAAGIRLRVLDARDAVSQSPDGRYDVVVGDVFRGARMPRRVASAEFAAQVARVLGAGGLYVLNVTDQPPLAFSRVQAATLRSVFGDVCVVGDPGMLRGKRFGNVVLAAAREPGGLPSDRLARRVALDQPRGRLLHGADVDAFIGGAHPLHDPA